MIAAALAAVVVAGCGRGGRVALPADFPADLPVPAAGRLRAAQDLGPRGLNLVWEVPGAAADAGAAHDAQMAAAGWTPVAQVALEYGLVRSWRKGERAAAVAVATAGTGVTLSIGYHAPAAAGAGGGTP